MLEITSEGGFINPTAHLAQLPAVVVDADGHIYMPDLSGTPGLVQVVSMRDVGAGGAAQILAAIRTAGIDTPGHDCGVAADTGVSVFTVEIGGQEIVNRFAASGPGGTGCNTFQTAALDLLNRLTDPTETWGAPSAPASTYAPVAYRMWAAPVDTAAGQSTIDWPLATPLATFGTPATPDFGVTGLRSGIILGGDAPTLAGALAGGQQGDLFLSNGHAYQFWVRALLPDELG